MNVRRLTKTIELQYEREAREKAAEYGRKAESHYRDAGRYPNDASRHNSLAKLEESYAKREIDRAKDQEYKAKADRKLFHKMINEKRGKMDIIRYEDFQKVDIRVGKIVNVENFPEARKPSYKLKIDFGDEIGIKKSCAQLPPNYKINDLLGKLVLCVINFPPRQIGPVISEVLTLGVPDGKNECFLITPDADVPLGGRLY